MNCLLTEACPECDDSPLSLASNVLGLLTFAFSLFLSAAAFLAITRNANDEAQDIYESLAQTREHINHIHGYLVGLVTQSDPVVGSMASLVRDAYGNFIAAHRDARAHLEKLGECDKDGTNFHLPPSMWARIRWWYYEKDTATKLGKLESHKQNFTTILLTLIAR